MSAPPPWSPGGGEEPAPPDVAALLRIEPAEKVFSYSWRIAGPDHTPLLDGVTYYAPALLEVVPDLPGHDSELAGGAYDRLESELEMVLRHEDVVSARMPRPDEAHRLDLDAGIPLIEVLRVTPNDRTGDAVEVEKMLLPAGRNELRYLV